jgi:hypothetical protein
MDHSGSVQITESTNMEHKGLLNTEHGIIKLMNIITVTIIQSRITVQNRAAHMSDHNSVAKQQNYI